MKNPGRLLAAGLAAAVLAFAGGAGAQEAKHYRFAHDKQVIDAIKAMIDETAQGLHVIATGSQGVRSIYAKKEIHNVGDLKGMKIRVQATATEDAIFPAYGAQTVHMPFGSVYTSLQTG